MSPERSQPWYAEVVRELLGEPVAERSLQRSVDMAVATVPGADYAGITLTRHKKVWTPAATDPLVEQIDAWQYRLKQGPCLDAIWQDDICQIPDLHSETRWPQWTPRAVELGARSVLSVRLATPEHTIGGLNLYSRASYAFDEQSIDIAHAYAAIASSALRAVERAEGLQTAMQSRHVIGMAQGMLMLRYGLDEDQSFRFLARVSQSNNIKLRDVAVRTVQELQSEAGATSSNQTVLGDERSGDYPTPA